MKKVIVHHSASSKYTTVEQINQWHKDKCFPMSQLGYFVGYHYVIPADGQVVQCRNPEEDGAHCNAFDQGEKTSFNKSSIGICVCGNFEIEEPSHEQTSALGALLRQLNPDIILGHRDVKDTLCPGEHLYKILHAIKAGIKEEQIAREGELG